MPGILDGTLRILTDRATPSMLEHHARDADGFLRARIEYLEGV